MKKGISVITGGSGGMGKAIARELGAGTRLLLAARDETKLNEAKKELEALGYEVSVFPVDVSDQKQVRVLAEFASSLGKVIKVIHTAGVSPTDSSVDEILSINAMGTINVTEAFYPLLTHGGVMINFASLVAYTMEAPDEWYEVFDDCRETAFYGKMQELISPFQGDDFVCAGVAYCVSKRFVIYYSQKNTLRFAGNGCRILTLSPGSYMTPMHQKLITNQPDTAEAQKESIPFARWGRPYEIASLTAYLCSPGAGFISGIDVLTDGGQIANTFVSQLE